MTELEKKVVEKINKLIDPETGLTFGDMKLIQSVKETEAGTVKIDFTPTSPVCPIAVQFAIQIRNKARQVAGVKKAIVYCHGHVWEDMINNMVNEETPKGEGRR